MPISLDAVIVVAAGIALPSLAFWSSYKSAVNAAQRRLYRKAYGVGAVLAGLVCLVAFGSAKGTVPLWLAVGIVVLWCLFLPAALAWLRRELEVRAREPYVDMFR